MKMVSIDFVNKLLGEMQRTSYPFVTLPYQDALCVFSHLKTLMVALPPVDDAKIEFVQDAAIESAFIHASQMLRGLKGCAEQYNVDEVLELAASNFEKAIAAIRGQQGKA